MTDAHLWVDARRYLAQEEVCSRAELEQCLVLWGAGTAEAAASLVQDWEARGWVEAVELDEPAMLPMLRLSEGAAGERSSEQRAT